MQKLKNSIIAKMIEARLTNKEIDFLIYVSRFQNDNGVVSGAYYRSVRKYAHEFPGILRCQKYADPEGIY